MTESIGPQHQRPAHLDHVVVATPDLAAEIERIESATGVRAQVGGVHPTFGTRNALMTFGGDAYLEIIGLDPDADPDLVTGPPPFALEGLAETRVSTWVLHPPSIEDAVAAARAAGADPGDPGPGSRRTADGDLLTWRLTPPLADPSGLLPFLIDWGATTTPARTIEPALDLLDLRACHPDPPSLQAVLAALGTDLPVEEGPPSLALVVAGPAGRLTL